jgi:transposase-like protein
MNSESFGSSAGLVETEGARRATGVFTNPARPAAPDPAVSEKAKRRRFSGEYKLRILREVERAKAPGEVGAILRREGLYSSHLSEWRRQRDRSAKAGLAATRRGPKPRREDPRVKQLEREKARLERKLRQAETIIEIQKKVAEILGIPLKSLDSDELD